MTDRQRQALDRLGRLRRQPNPDALDDVYPEAFGQNWVHETDDPWLPNKYLEDLKVAASLSVTLVEAVARLPPAYQDEVAEHLRREGGGGG